MISEPRGVGLYETGAQLEVKSIVCVMTGRCLGKGVKTKLVKVISREKASLEKTKSLNSPPSLKLLHLSFIVRS